MSEPLRLAARAAAVLCFAALWSSSAFGTTKTWGNYEGGGNWNNPLNWSPAGVPTSADDVVISSSGGNCNIDVNAFASSVTVQNGGVLWVLAGNLLTVSGAIDVNSGGVLNTNSSNIQSNGVLTLNGTLHHFGGTILGSGSLSIGSGGVLEFWGTDNSSVLTLPTTNAGTITFLNTVVPPKNYTFNAGTLTNNGTIDIQTDEPINDGGIAGTLTNDGTLKKSVGSGTCDFNLTVNNGATGTVKSQSGTLALVAGGSNSGTFDTTAGAAIGIAATMYTFNSGASVTGSGTLALSGTLYVNTGVDVTWPNVNLSATTSKIDGPGALRVSGNFTWDGGTVTGSGTRELQSTSTPTIGCSAGTCRLDGAALQLKASGTFSASANALDFANAATLTISAGKTLTINNDGDISGSGTITNNGVISKTTTAGTSTVAPALINNAQIKATAGTLALFGNGTHADTSSFTPTSPGTIAFAGGTHTIQSLISGTGTIAFTGATATVVNSFSIGTLSISAGTVTLSSTAFGSPTAFTLSGGTLTGSGTLQVGGTFTWSAGTITGSGTRQLKPGSTPTIACSLGNCTLDGATLQLQASGTFSASTNSLVLANGATLSVGSNTTLSVTSDGSITSGGGSASSVSISGTLTKSAGAGTSTIGVPVANISGATVRSQSGTLALSAGGTDNGTFDTSAGAVIALTGGTFTITLGTTVTGSGTVDVSGATVNINNTSAITLNAPMTISSGTVNLNDGNVTGAGALSVSGTVNVYGGSIQGSGPLTINGGGIVNFRGTMNSSNLARDTTNDGTINYTNDILPSWEFVVFNNAVLTNNGTVDIQTDHNIRNLGGTPRIDNQSGGILKKSFGSGSSTIDFTVNNAAGGIVRSQAGTLALTGGGASSGAFDTTAGTAMITIASAAYTLADGATITGSSGKVSAGSTLNIPGTLTVSGTLNLTGAPTVNAGTSLSLGGTLELGAGVAIPNVQLTATTSTVTGPWLLDISGTFTWNGGTMTGGGTTALTGTSTPTLACSLGNCALDNRTLTLGSSASYTASANALALSNGATLDVAAGGTLAITNNGSVTNGAGSNGITNNGTIWKKTTAGTSVIAVPITQAAGTIDVSSGTLQLGGGAGVSGGTIKSTGGTPEVTGGSFEILGAATMTGGFKVSGGTLRVDTGVTQNISSLILAGGTVDGGGTLVLNGISSWSGGTVGSAAAPGGITQIDPGQTLFVQNLSTVMLTNGRQLINKGTITGSVVDWKLTGASGIDNSGAFTINAGNIATDASANVFNNSGTLTCSAPAQMVNIKVDFTNTGTVNATAGVLNFLGSGTHTGSFTANGASIGFGTGTNTINAPSSISGSGGIGFGGPAGTTTINVPFSIGSLSATGGTAALNGNVTAGTLNMIGGTLGGGGNLTLTNGGTWSGGTMSGSGTTIVPAAGTLTATTSAITLDRTLRNDGAFTISRNVNGAGTINNNGTLSVTANAVISPTVNNNGQITTSNTLTFSGSGTHGGTFTVTSPGVLDFSGGTQNISGTIAGTGTVRFSGANATLTGNWSGMAFDVAAGSVALNTSGSMPALSLSGGTIAGSGDITVSGPSTWSGGTIGGGGALTFGPGAVVTLPGTSAATLNRPLLNNGTINFAAASSSMLIDGVPVTNDGTLDIQSSQSILATAGTPALTNNGTLKKSAGAGATQFGAPIVNTGLVQIAAGTLNFTGAYTQSAGTTDILPGATLQTGTLALNGGALTGNGTVIGTVDNHALVSPGASPGVLTISGDYVQASNATLDIQIGGTAPGTQYDQLAVTGSVTLDGTLHVIPINGFVPVTGNAFQILTFDTRPNNTTFAVTTGLDYGSGNALHPTYTRNDLRLIDNNVQADLAASVSAPPSVANGSAFAYIVSIANAGGSDATGVTFTATLSPNVTFTGASPAVCTGAPNLVCTIDALANQDTAVVTLNVIAAGSSAAPLSVTATGNEFDPNYANNGAAASTSITSVTDLRVSVNGPASTLAGSHAIYTIAVTNDGPDAAAGVALSAAPSSGLTFGANSGACAGGFPCSLGTLGSGQSVTIGSAWTIAPSATGSVHLDVSATTSTPDANAANNSATATTLIGTCPDIAITAPVEMIAGASAAANATPFPGATFTWSITNGAIDSGNGTDTIAFTAGNGATTTLTVNVTGGGCNLTAAFQVTIKPAQTCVGTATPILPADGATVDAVVPFQWDSIAGASGYRLWLVPADAAAQDLGTTLGTSLTRTIAPGSYHWFVETLFDGCASHESQRPAFTILPAQDCATRGKPQPASPADATTISDPAVTFSWNTVPSAIAYELWLGPSLGVPTLIQTTAGTSYTASVPEGVLEWFVRALFAGCAATESDHRTFTYTPPPDCSANQPPLLITPAEGGRLTSPVSFDWSDVDGATSYDLYIDGALAKTTTVSKADGVSVPLDERRWFVRAHFAPGCAALDSAESRFAVIAPAPACTPLTAPVIAAPGQLSSGVSGRLQWSFVSGATGYIVEVSSDPTFAPAATLPTSTTEQQMTFSGFTNTTAAPIARYVRVHAVDTKCIPATVGPFSSVAVMYILPAAGTGGSAQLTDPTTILYTVTISVALAGRSFTATPTASWISVTPTSGVVPAGGQLLRVSVHTAGLPPGTNTGGVTVIAKAAGSLAALDDETTTTTISVNTVAPVSSTPKDTPPPDALIIPVVAHAAGLSSQFASDIRITNTSPKAMNYQLTFVPTGDAGISTGQQSTLTINSGVTVALDDVLPTWFGSGDASVSGTLEIRPTESIVLPAPPPGGPANVITFATSRLYNKTANGTFGQYIPAAPFGRFIAKGGVLSLQQVAESAKYRTNLGLVEGSGNPADVLVRVLDAGGKKITDFPIHLTGGQHMQLNRVLAGHGITLDDGRIEVEVTGGAGKVTAYASVLDNASNDPLFVPPATLADAGNTNWVIPGVADLDTIGGHWQSDVRILNAGAKAAALTLAFYSQKGGEAKTQSMTIAPGEVRQLDRVLSQLGVSNDGGALHISSNAAAQVTATARTYKQTDNGTFGQFIAAVTPQQSAGVGSRSLQILQVEQSADYRTNIGFAEVTGKPVTLQLTVIAPGAKVGAAPRITLAANQFVQYSLADLGITGDARNVRISVSAVSGSGRATAYASVIDSKTGDPTFIPAQ